MVVDIVVLAILLISALIAFLRGMIREVLTILGVVGGLAASYACGPALTGYMKGWLGVVEGEPEQRLFDLVPYSILATGLAYGAIFIIVVIALSIFSHFLAEAARNLGLGPVDRTLGVVFGLLRGAVLLGILYLPIYMLVDPETKTRWFEGSHSYGYLEQGASVIAGFLPEEAIQKVDAAAREGTDILDTREKLQEMDVLRKDDAGTQQQQPQSSEDPNAPGYDQKNRQDINQLFQQETTPAQNP